MAYSKSAAWSSFIAIQGSWWLVNPSWLAAKARKMASMLANGPEKFPVASGLALTQAQSLAAKWSPMSSFITQSVHRSNMNVLRGWPWMVHPDWNAWKMASGARQFHFVASRLTILNNKHTRVSLHFSLVLWKSRPTQITNYDSFEEFMLVPL